MPYIYVYPKWSQKFDQCAAVAHSFLKWRTRVLQAHNDYRYCFKVHLKLIYIRHCTVLTKIFIALRATMIRKQLQLSVLTRADCRKKCNIISTTTYFCRPKLAHKVELS